MSESKVFSLEGKSLKLDTAEDIEPHIKALKDNEDVEEVRFLGNTLGIGASEALAKVLETKKKLQVANFADVFTGRLLSEIPQALSALLTALLALPNLYTVNLSDNAFGLNTQAPLVDFLSQHVPLRHLILNNNGLGPAAGILIADALTTLAEKKDAARKQGKEVPHLETIICGRNRLEAGSMAAWAKTFAAHTGIKEVKMVQNGIRPEGITHVLNHGFVHSTQIETLDLQDNTFTVKGAKVLANVVGNWSLIRDLGVGDCLIKGRGGIAFAAALQKGKNTKLEILRLEYNDINAEGVAGLAAALPALPALRRIELEGNKFSAGDAAIATLRAELAKRREAAGVDDENDENWGVGELEELDSEDDDEDDDDDDDEAKAASDEEDEGVEAQEKAARDIIADQQAEDANVAQRNDKDVDELADALAKTDIKAKQG
ncbi:ran GTPase activating protein 1 [Karstenula rhodostoma CBS 690.94]|uniref:Ran GTPase activating protein 1 n=1 Tax=Karstenula rhodostoma CBS 690.94 TaxID=1392251 RepID=A0A9P4U5X2_9PLEO|nr:ran GTPase activating protein 1 [Karstenula rhodostoma CBS 690.94]